jgi:hypothetical protein
MTSDTPGLPPASPRADAWSSLALGAVGVLAATVAWRMDRYESQGGTLWTAPGLWPAIVALVLLALAAALAFRSWRRARAIGWQASILDDTPRVPTRRFAWAAAGFFVYALVLVGRGLPFWLGTALFVSGYVYVFHTEGTARTQARRVAMALAVGIATALVVSLVFERVFLVRLP